MTRWFALLLLLPISANAADYRDCKELFVSPLLVYPPDTKPDGRVWDDGSPPDPELIASSADHPTAGRFIVGAKQQDTVTPRWNSLFLEASSTGKWLPVRVGDSLTLTLSDRDALSDDTMAVFSTTIPKDLASSGLAYLTIQSKDQRSRLALRVSVHDGERSCKGIEFAEQLVVTLPEGGMVALPDKELFEAVRSHNRCNLNAGAPACRSTNYEVYFADLNEDGVHDTVIRGGPFGPARAFVLGFALGFEPGKRQEPVILDCDDSGVLKPGEITCTSGGKTSVIEVRKGSAGVRTASDKEVELSRANTGALRATEARTNLKALYTAQKVYFAVNDRYARDFTTAGFRPGKGNRYHYFLAARGAVANEAAPYVLPVIYPADTGVHPEAKLPSGLKEAGCPLTFGTNADGEPVGLGFSGAGSEQHFTAYALGNVDDDTDFDCWSISSIERKSAAGEVIPAGVPHHEKADYEGEQVAKESP